ncbi:hypothetical protein NE857_22380 [Nocardiopsis exhalans]|uniref:DUF4261 domain-containing protein n=1 Tax=Nocardiopsis exhalans TaxID=163604 RepID=A0ABY5D181_9ACTN|nr:hypothetical protein [Nocardiopsis exhalans]USY18064.1 hypothetical protein NE857_22380 [Nocardiopsis exhalans]
MLVTHVVLALDTAPLPWAPVGPEDDLVVIGNASGRVSETVVALTGQEPAQLLSGITPHSQVRPPVGVLLEGVASPHAHAFVWEQVGVLLRLLADRSPEWIRLESGYDPDDFFVSMLRIATEALYEQGTTAQLWGVVPHSGPGRVDMTGIAQSMSYLPHIEELRSFDPLGWVESEPPATMLRTFAYQPDPDGVGYRLTSRGALLRGLLLHVR